MTMDFIGRAALTVFFGFSFTVKSVQIWAFLINWPAVPDLRTYLDLAGMSAALAFGALLIMFTVIRLPPKGSAQGWEPRFTAIAGTFLMMALVLVPQHEVSPTIRAIAVAFMGIGIALSTYVLIFLGRSFSIMAQARKLVTAGPYKVVRHPLYICEEIAAIGMVINVFSIEAALVGLVHFGFQVRRMMNEESVLRAAFPEYTEYAKSTPMLVPWLKPNSLPIMPHRPQSM